MTHTYMKVNEHVFLHSSFWVEKGVLFCQFAKDLTINEDLAKLMVQERKTAFGNKKMPLFVDVGNLLSIDRSARRYLASKDAWEFLSAGAIYSNNKLLEILGKAWFQLDKPVVPVTVFSNRDSALQWLQQYKKDQV